MNASSASTALGGAGTILLADNEPGVRAFIRHVLQQRGYKVLEAKNGDEAIQQAKQHGETIRLFICDVVLPDLSGWSLVEKIVALQPGVKVLFISGYPDEIVAKLGVADCLEKPFSSTTLTEKVRQMLER